MYLLVLVPDRTRPGVQPKLAESQFSVSVTPHNPETSRYQNLLIKKSRFSPESTVKSHKHSELSSKSPVQVIFVTADISPINAEYQEDFRSNRHVREISIDGRYGANSELILRWMQQRDRDDDYFGPFDGVRNTDTHPVST
jgi:hypothetical protein